jgi:hypothetical protein
VELSYGKGKRFVMSIDCLSRSAKHDRFWQQLLSRMGVQVQHENILPESEEAAKINDLLRVDLRKNKQDQAIKCAHPHANYARIITKYLTRPVKLQKLFF